MDLTNHPCFNSSAHRRFGRVHLPVAPRCNIQCKFCDRQFDCVNESRPGVTSTILSPVQALNYLKEVMRQKENIRVVGIAGPGDPFANPDQTLETLSLVRKEFPDMMLCVATNGLELPFYLNDLAELNVTHVTITVNAVDPAIAEKIYAWMKIGKKTISSCNGVKYLLERQLEGIRGLKERGIMVKVNSIIIPGINENHIEAVAKVAGEMGVDLFNCMPYYPNKGSAFGHLSEPDPITVEDIRRKASVFVKQMRHCTRCRADAAGLLGEALSPGLMTILQKWSRVSDNHPGSDAGMARRPYVAVTSMEGALVNQHLGEAMDLRIYGKKNGEIDLISMRKAPKSGSGTRRWEELSRVLGDCHALLVSGVGPSPLKILQKNGIRVIECEGLIHEAVRAVLAGENIRHMAPLKRIAGPGDCGGMQTGCG